MKRAEATRLGKTLVAAGVLTDAQPGPNEGKAQKALHGPAAIVGHWADSGTRRGSGVGRGTLLGCVHVAEALLAGWSVEAVRSCRHTVAAAPALARVA